MGTRCNLIMVVMLGLLVLSACSGGNTSPTSPSPSTLPNGSMTATIDGSPWSASGFIVVQYRPNAPAAPLVITGSDSLDTNTARYIVTLASPWYRTGTFTACPADTCVFLSVQMNGSLWSAGPIQGSSGTIFLSRLTAHNAIGTFSFVGVDLNGTRKSVTNGSFNVTY